MSDYGDYEPEDAWHPDDSIDDQMTNIRARFEALGFPHSRIHRLLSVGPGENAQRVELDDMLAIIRQQGSQRIRLQSSDNNRAMMLIEDIEFVKKRLED